MGGYITKVCNPEQYNEKTDDGPSYRYEYDSAGRLVQLTGRAMLTMWTEI